MLARVLAMALCPSVCVCLSVTSRSSIETAERIELIFGMGASFHPSYTVLTGNSAHSKKYEYFPLELCPKLRTWKISPRHIDRRNVFSTLLEKDGRSERDKPDRRRSAKLTVPSSSDARPLVYHSSVYSTVPRAGQLATADTCFASVITPKGSEAELQTTCE